MRAAAARKGPATVVDVHKRHAVSDYLGIRLISVRRKRVVAEMTITPSHINRSNRVAGGLIMAFADVLGARGTFANLPEGTRTTTIESKTNFFAAGDGPVLKGVSIPLHIGRTTMVWQTTISNADDRRVAIVTQTQMVIPALKAPESAQAPAAKVDSARRPAKSSRRRSPIA